MHGARTARRRGGVWRAGFDASQGAGRPGKGAWLGWRAASIGGGLERGCRGGTGAWARRARAWCDVAAQRAAGTSSFCCPR
jgi:hypothetical protein